MDPRLVAFSPKAGRSEAENMGRLQCDGCVQSYEYGCDLKWIVYTKRVKKLNNKKALSFLSFMLLLVLSSCSNSW